MPKSLRFKFEYIKAVIQRYKIQSISIVLSAIFISVSLPFWLRFFNQPKFKTEYKSHVGLYTNNQLPVEVAKKISFGLTSEQDDGSFTFSPLVKQYQLSLDGRTHTFKLNQFMWHNGKQLSSQDIISNLPGASEKTVSTDTLEIETITPNTALFTTLSKPLIKDGSIGLGDYKIQRIVYQDGYLRKVELVPVSKNITRLVYQIYPTIQDALLGYKQGEVDSVVDLPQSTDIPPWPKIKSSSYIDFHQYAALFINTQKFSDKKFRQALAYATNKSEYRKDLAISPFSPLNWAYSTSIKTYPQNPERAKELFKGNTLTKIQIMVNDRNLLSTAALIKKDWEEILKLQVEIVPRTQADLGDYDILLAFSPIPSDPDQYAFWHSTQSITNLTRLSDPKIDKLLEEGRQTFNQVERRQIYFQFQQTLAEETPAIFLFYPTRYSFARIKSP